MSFSHGITRFLRNYINTIFKSCGTQNCRSVPLVFWKKLESRRQQLVVFDVRMSKGEQINKIPLMSPVGGFSTPLISSCQLWHDQKRLEEEIPCPCTIRIIRHVSRLVRLILMNIIQKPTYYSTLIPLQQPVGLDGKLATVSPALCI